MILCKQNKTRVALGKDVCISYNFDFRISLSGNFRCATGAFKSKISHNPSVDLIANQ